MKDKIMIVDDEKYIRMLYAEELEDEGYNVVTISTGFDIVNKIEKEDPDLIVMDIRFKDYDGLDLLQTIKNRFEDLPVGICSAYDTFKDDMKSLAADFYVVRSIDLSELKNNIASTLNDYRRSPKKLEVYHSMSL
jgi:two-component system, response regulator, stage 0 sporulation protein F